MGPLVPKGTDGTVHDIDHEKPTKGGSLISDTTLRSYQRLRLTSDTTAEISTCTAQFTLGVKPYETKNMVRCSLHSRS